ncbi:MAG: hypothetical protein JWM17_276 [Actinobacteria bacterium]|nr:hypothetical protein [Actinomycetota bacterium]
MAKSKAYILVPTTENTPTLVSIKYSGLLRGLDALTHSLYCAAHLTSLRFWSIIKVPVAFLTPNGILAAYVYEDGVSGLAFGAWFSGDGRCPSSYDSLKLSLKSATPPKPFIQPKLLTLVHAVVHPTLFMGGVMRVMVKRIRHFPQVSLQSSPSPRDWGQCRSRSARQLADQGPPGRLQAV